MDKNYNLAKHLRQSQTPQETILWNLLRNRKILNTKFKRQYPVGNYIVDFASPEIKLIIEIDGGQHNQTQNIEYDSQRTSFLNSLGYTVIRFWNNEINDNLEGVYEKISMTIENLKKLS